MQSGKPRDKPAPDKKEGKKKDKKKGKDKSATLEEAGASPDVVDEEIMTNTEETNESKDDEDNKDQLPVIDESEEPNSNQSKMTTRSHNVSPKMTTRSHHVSPKMTTRSHNVSPKMTTCSHHVSPKMTTRSHNVSPKPKLKDQQVKKKYPTKKMSKISTSSSSQSESSSSSSDDSTTQRKDYSENKSSPDSTKHKQAVEREKKAGTIDKSPKKSPETQVSYKNIKNKKRKVSTMSGSLSSSEMKHEEVVHHSKRSKTDVSTTRHETKKSSHREPHKSVTKDKYKSQTKMPDPLHEETKRKPNIAVEENKSKKINSHNLKNADKHTHEPVGDVEESFPGAYANKMDTSHPRESSSEYWMPGDYFRVRKIVSDLDTSQRSPHKIGAKFNVLKSPSAYNRKNAILLSPIPSVIPGAQTPQNCWMIVGHKSEKSSSQGQPGRSLKHAPGHSERSLTVQQAKGEAEQTENDQQTECNLMKSPEDHSVGGTHIEELGSQNVEDKIKTKTSSKSTRLSTLVSQKLNQIEKEIQTVLRNESQLSDKLETSLQLINMEAEGVSSSPSQPTDEAQQDTPLDADSSQLDQDDIIEGNEQRGERKQAPAPEKSEVETVKTDEDLVPEMQKKEPADTAYEEKKKAVLKLLQYVAPSPVEERQSGSDSTHLPSQSMKTSTSTKVSSSQPERTNSTPAGVHSVAAQTNADNTTFGALDRLWESEKNKMLCPMSRDTSTWSTGQPEMVQAQSEADTLSSHSSSQARGINSLDERDTDKMIFTSKDKSSAKPKRDSSVEKTGKDMTEIKSARVESTQGVKVSETGTLGTSRLQHEGTSSTLADEDGKLKQRRQDTASSQHPLQTEQSTLVKDATDLVKQSLTEIFDKQLKRFLDTTTLDPSRIQINWSLAGEKKALPPTAAQGQRLPSKLVTCPQHSLSRTVASKGLKPATKAHIQIRSSHPAVQSHLVSKAIQCHVSHSVTPAVIGTQKTETDTNKIDSTRPPKPDNDIKRPPKTDTDIKRLPKTDTDTKRLTKLDTVFKRLPKSDTDIKRLPKPETDFKKPPQSETDFKSLLKSDTDTKRHPKPDTDTKRPPKPDNDTKRLPKLDTDIKRPPKPDNDTKRPPKPDNDTKRPPKPDNDTKRLPKLDTDIKIPPKPDNDTKRLPKLDIVFKRLPKSDTDIKRLPDTKHSDTKLPVNKDYIQCKVRIINLSHQTSAKASPDQQAVDDSFQTAKEDISTPDSKSSWMSAQGEERVAKHSPQSITSSFHSLKTETLSLWASEIESQNYFDAVSEKKIMESHQSPDPHSKEVHDEDFESFKSAHLDLLEDEMKTPYTNYQASTEVSFQDVEDHKEVKHLTICAQGDSNVERGTKTVEAGRHSVSIADEKISELPTDYMSVIEKPQLEELTAFKSLAEPNKQEPVDTRGQYHSKMRKRDKTIPRIVQNKSQELEEDTFYEISSFESCLAATEKSLTGDRGKTTEQCHQAAADKHCNKSSNKACQELGASISTMYRDCDKDSDANMWLSTSFYNRTQSEDGFDSKMFSSDLSSDFIESLYVDDTNASSDISLEPPEKTAIVHLFCDGPAQITPSYLDVLSFLSKESEASPGRSEPLSSMRKEQINSLEKSYKVVQNQLDVSANRDADAPSQSKFLSHLRFSPASSPSSPAERSLPKARRVSHTSSSKVVSSSHSQAEQAKLKAGNLKPSSDFLKQFKFSPVQTPVSTKLSALPFYLRCGKKHPVFSRLS
ncbi:serine-rich adhesin for platelets-like [Physella acuta]|uniref:serine-rich adhesin for platelets-like n=1 Tax=Physella acuta TaxID=109671 RepID=UPI0027DB50F1|nr:serine-rich adhesin for platelets-like [Physella acuta]